MMGSKALAHNVRLFDLEPRSAHGLCLSPSGELLALARTRNESSEEAKEEEEAWIEVWNIRGGNPLFQYWLPTGESSLEALAFGSKDLIYSTGLHGWILSHQIHSGVIKKTPVSWGAAWCLDFHPETRRIAIGTEEGVVCIFREEDTGLHYEKCLDKQEGRILCIAWEPHRGEKIVTGSADTLRVWDTQTGHPLHRLSTARTFKTRETTVWSLAYLENEVIISGDSRGKTSFWNGKTGTLLDSYQTHKADVLTVAVDRKQSIAYSTGIDPVVMHFQPVLHKDRRSKWVKSIHRSLNEHDNRSILPIGSNTIALVGIDSYLTLIESKIKLSYAPLPYGEAISLSSEIGCLLFRNPNSLDLWRLGTTKEELKSTSLCGSVMKIDEQPVKILTLANNDGRAIRCSDISESGKFIAFAIPSLCRFYELHLKENLEPSLKRIKGGDNYTDIHHIKFIPGTSKCILVNHTGNLILLSILEDDGELSLHKLKEIPRNQMKLTSSISKFYMEGDTLVLADFDDNVVVVNYETGSLVSQLPRYTQAPVSSVTISHNKTLVFITYSNGIVVECSVKTGKYTDFSNRYLSLSPEEIIYKNERRLTIRSAFYDTQNEDTIIMHDSSSVYIIDKCKVLQQEKSGQKKRTKRVMGLEIEMPSDKIEKISVKALDRFENLLFFSRIQKDSVAVEVLKSRFEDKLPPSFKVKKFGQT